MTDDLLLPGLDGGNPLAFLAALGTLRSLSLAWPKRNIKMAWRQVDGAWRPALTLSASDHEAVLEILLAQCRSARSHPTLNLADNLTIPILDYHRHLSNQAATDVHGDTEFAAALGSDACSDDKGNIVDTALRTMSGAGHQHFLKTMRAVLETATPQHLSKTLFNPWLYDDALQGLNLRFDPLDDKRYALRWNDPSGDPTRGTQGSMLGANALAVLGIPLLIVAPVNGRLETTGFQGRASRDCFWSWPIWNVPINIHVVRSILAAPELQCDPPTHHILSARGIAAVYRCQRITNGKFRNFTPAQPV